MYTCSNDTISTNFTIPNYIKENEESLSKHNRYLRKKMKESEVPFNIIKISKNKLEKILQNDFTIKFSNKSLLQKICSSSRRHEHLNLKKDWDRIPQEVREEVLKLSKQKKLRKCQKNYSNKYTQELIEFYHNAKLLRERAEKLELIEKEERFEINKLMEIETDKNGGKLKINNSNGKSEINQFDDFCCKKDSISSLLMTKLNNKNNSTKELRNISEKVTEKLKTHMETNFQNRNSFAELKKKFQRIQNLVKNYQPQGKIYELKKEQQTIDVALMNQSLFLEQDILRKAEEEIQRRSKCKEDMSKEEEAFDLERTKERRSDTLLLLKSINLMENYIEELKFQL